MPATLPKSAVEQRICELWVNECRTAIAVFKAESGLRCEAVGDGHLTYIKNGIENGKSYGIAQIRHLPGRPSPDQLLDCEFNLQHAYGMWKAQGWQPWSAWKSGAYKKHLN